MDAAHAEGQKGTTSPGSSVLPHFGEIELPENFPEQYAPIQEALAVPPDLDEKDVPNFVMLQLATLEHQIGVLALSTRWSMAHVNEGFSELRTGLRQVYSANPATLKMGRLSNAESSGAPAESQQLENVLQLTERLESLVRSACGSIQETSTHKDKTMGIVKNIAGTLAAIEALIQLHFPARAVEDVPAVEDVHEPTVGGNGEGHMARRFTPRDQVGCLDVEPDGSPQLVHEPEHAAQSGTHAADLKDGRQGPEGEFGEVPPPDEATGASAESIAKELAEWMEHSTDRFNVHAFLKEFLGQTLFFCFGMLSLPFLYPLYGSVIALRNRGFLPAEQHGSRIFAIQCLSSSCLLGALFVYHFAHQTGGTDALELLIALGGNLMHCLIIAQKYAYMSRPEYHMYNTAVVTQERIVDQLLLTSWFIIPPRVCERSMSLAMTEIFGPGQRGGVVCFIPEPRTALGLMVPSRLQGKMTRSMVAELLLKGDMKACTSIPQDIDFSLDLQKTGKLCGAGLPSKGVLLSELFQYMVDAVLENEVRTSMRKFVYAVPVVTVCILFLPCLARQRTDDSFLGETWNVRTVFLLCFFSNLQHWGAFMMFLYVACLELVRRRTLVLCLCALLSNRWEDRKRVPKPIRALGVLDLRDVQTIRNVRALRDLCFEWGFSYRLRCTRILEASILSAGIYIGFFLLLAEFGLYSYITELLVFMVLTLSAFQTISIIGSAAVGQQLNGATGRCFYLLNHHRTALVLAKSQGLYGDPEELETAIASIELVAEHMQMEQDAHPVAILGAPMGFGLVSSLYVVAGLIAQRLAAYCTAEPHMCFG